MFYSVGTTNRGEYNYETTNRRYLGLRVSIDGEMIDNVHIVENYNKIMGALVWNVNNGMSGAIDKKVKADATYQQDIRIVETDLTVILRFAFAMAHIKDDIGYSDVARERIRERYQIDYKDVRGGDRKLIHRMYKISLTGLSTFAADYIDFQRRRFNVDISAIKSTITKVMVTVDCYVDDDDEIVTYDAAPKDKNGDIDETLVTYHPIYYKWEPRDQPERMPSLRNSIRGYALIIAAPDVAKIDKLAWQYILELQEFLEAKGNKYRIKTTNS
jgi:hypothetical protein